MLGTKKYTRTHFQIQQFWIASLLLALSVFAYSQPVFAQDLTPAQEQQLRAELQQIEKEIQEQQGILSKKALEGTSIQRDISILNAKIKSAQLKIRAHDLTISRLGKDISVKSNTITALDSRIGKSRDSLSQIIQRTREIDNYSMAEAMLSNEDISDFFIDLDAFASIKQDMKVHLDEIKTDKTQTEIVKKDLSTKRNQEIDIKVNVEKEKKIIEQSEAEKKRLLNLNKTEQKNYQGIIASKTQKANEIRNQLFKLRDAGPIKFGDAVTFAQAAAAKTGVRAAFILAIIQQESNLGANVGKCYLTDVATGAGVRTSGGAVSNLMKASRDVQPFLSITQALGRDPMKTVVSCPLSVGYGGAMGPAQFIPSTWQLFASKIAAALGKSASDPWNPQDAFMASGMYLGDLGASSQNYTAERNAACRYYSGKVCSGSNTFYGTQVMARVESIQANINILQGN